jgi:TRAP-type C4-dicarboxylate transport system permease small subunit
VSEPSRGRWHRLHRIEDGVIAVAVLALVLIAGAQILLRNAFDTGLAWADPLLRALVLWTAMLGALAAAREDKHIGLDLIAHYAPPRLARPLRRIALLFGATVSAVVAWHGIDLVALDFGTGENAFAGVPNWFVELIVPVGFGLLALRLAIHAFVPARHAGPALAPEMP